MYLALNTANMEVLNYIVVCLESATSLCIMIQSVSLLLHSYSHRENKHPSAISTSTVG